jgi:hypothetical protein
MNGSAMLPEAKRHALFRFSRNTMFHMLFCAMLMVAHAMGHGLAVTVVPTPLRRLRRCRESRNNEARANNASEGKRYNSHDCAAPSAPMIQRS